MVDFNRIWASTGPKDEPGVGGVESGHGTVVPPNNEYENYWKNRADIALQMIQRKGIMDWDVDAPYSPGAMVSHDGGIYYCYVASTGETPSTTPSKWESVTSPFMRAATTSTRGGVIKASNAETLAGASNKFPDAAAFLSAFIGANQSLAANGFQKLPGGLIIQWGLGVAQPTGSATYTYPIAFPNAYLVGFAQVAKTYSTDASIRHINTSLSTFGLDTSNQSNTDAEWFALGY